LKLKSDKYYETKIIFKMNKYYEEREYYHTIIMFFLGYFNTIIITDTTLLLNKTCLSKNFNSKNFGGWWLV